ncbi:MAG: tyrosine-type recombinase/integrase, partial [Thermoanaerobaculia bacterium]
MQQLQERFDTYLDRTSIQKSPRTERWERRSFSGWRRFLEEGLGLPAEAFEARVLEVDEWATWNRRRGVSPITVNSYWRGLRLFFNDWERREDVVNPFRRSRTPRFQAAPPKALTQTDCRRLLLTAANMPRWDRFQRARNTALLATMLYAGLRLGEVLALLYADVDLEEGTLRVVRGKGRYGGRTRLAEVGPDLTAILNAYVKERRHIGYQNPEFFSSLAGGRLGVGGINHLIRTVRAASGVRFSAHVLRHSFVTHLLRAGVPLYIARDLAGHANISTTLGYTKVF